MPIRNSVMMQCFHWYIPADGTLWDATAARAKDLAEAGFTAAWLPPAYKGIGGAFDVGYGVYDMYDLGEFDQKGTVEIEDYLPDRVPPLMVADSVGTLAGASVEGATAEIGSWAERQQHQQPDLPLVDLLYHALHKLGVIGEFHLVEKEKLLAFLRAVGEELAAACPPGEDRERFRRALEHLGVAELVRTGLLGMRKKADTFEPLAPTTPGLRRLSFLEQRLRREGLARGPAAEIARRRVASQDDHSQCRGQLCAGHCRDHCPVKQRGGSRLAPHRAHHGPRATSRLCGRTTTIEC